VLRGEGRGSVSITVVLTDDPRIQELNREFRGLDRPTDVLAFPADPDPADPYLGDVVVSVERTTAQAPRFHNDPETELARVVAHGILHLLGYDHHAPADGRRMKAAERRALELYEPGMLLFGAEPPMLGR
jgi:probable rRNA maturation factor